MSKLSKKNKKYNKNQKYNKNKKKSLRRKNKNKKGGFKYVLPSEYFNPYFTNYSSNPMPNPNAVSYGHIHNNARAGPDLYQMKPMKQCGGGALPAEYYGGNSGRYFEAGSPELSTCTHAYGRNITTSNGVVMEPPHNMWAGPNLAPFPLFKDMTGGGCGCNEENCKKIPKKKTKKPKKNLNKIIQIIIHVGIIHQNSLKEKKI